MKRRGNNRHVDIDKEKVLNLLAPFFIPCTNKKSDDKEYPQGVSMPRINGLF
jgi:hypothetical protein